jgi:GDPmannose 4,6-dehydratase
VREFVEETGKILGFDIEWQGDGQQEVGIDKNTGKVIIEIDPRYYRPAEVDLLLGDSTKAHEKLGWKPDVDFKALVKLMVEAELEEINS